MFGPGLFLSFLVKNYDDNYNHTHLLGPTSVLGTVIKISHWILILPVEWALLLSTFHEYNEY